MINSKYWHRHTSLLFRLCIAFWLVVLTVGCQSHESDESDLPTSRFIENFDASRLISQVAESLAISYTSASAGTPCRSIPFSSGSESTNIQCDGNFELQSPKDAKRLIEGVFAEIEKEIQGPGRFIPDVEIEKGPIFSYVCSKLSLVPVEGGYRLKSCARFLQEAGSFYLQSCQDLYHVKGGYRSKSCTIVHLYFVSGEERADAIAYTYLLTIDEQTLKIPIFNLVE